MGSRFFTYLYLTSLGLACTEKTNNVISTEKEDSTNILTHEFPESFNFGRVATKREIDSIDIDVRADGIGLPNGSGTVDRGRILYAVKCAMCHGKTGTEGPFDKLVAVHNDSLPIKVRAIGSYWPYATTLYDYIHRAMPYNTPGTLTANEVFSLTAFLLYKNQLVDSSFVVDANNLPQVEMPAKKYFEPDNRPGGPEMR